MVEKNPSKARVQKLISNYGYCSRRRAEELIDAGKVTVNGETISLGDQATESDVIKVNGTLIKPQNKSYYLFNKPLECVTALRDKNCKTIMDFIKGQIEERIIPVGRLDYNTSGMLLLTNDGDFANKVSHPSNEVNKTYLVQTSASVPARILKLIEGGIPLEDGFTRPAKIKKHSHDTLEITIHEGKNRIVRRLFEKFDHKVIALKRTRIGRLELGKLEEGKVRPLTPAELKLIFQ